MNLLVSAPYILPCLCNSWRINHNHETSMLHWYVSHKQVNEQEDITYHTIDHLTMSKHYFVPWFFTKVLLDSTKKFQSWLESSWKFTGINKNSHSHQTSGFKEVCSSASYKSFQEWCILKFGNCPIYLETVLPTELVSCKRLSSWIVFQKNWQMENHVNQQPFAFSGPINPWCL